MKKKFRKNIFSAVLILVMILMTIPAVSFAGTSSAEEEVVILYSSDVHGQCEANLGYSGMVAYANEERAQGKKVFIIDAGDAVSGSVYSAVSRGAYSIEAMNLAGYTAAVPGVKDFDYGVNRFMNVLANSADFPYISCNLIYSDDETPVFKPYEIVSSGSKKVAFIGISNPQTMAQASADFEKKYNFGDDDEGEYLYYLVQKAVNSAVLDGADYIIAVSQLPLDPQNPYSADAVIRNTTGIHAMIQGGTNSPVTGEKIRDAQGNVVLLSRAGAEMSSFGVLTIRSDRTMEAKMVTEYKLRDIATKDKIEALQAGYNSDLGKTIAVSSSCMEAVSSNGERIIDGKETNLGDLVADAYRTIADADIAFAESRTIGANIELGDVTYKDAMKALPGGEKICVAEVSGADIMDALEMSARLYPNENEKFLQVSGLTYDIQETVIPAVSLDGFGNFSGIDGQYRVTNIMIDGKELDLFETYTVAATRGLLSGSTGYSMFRNGVIVQNDVDVDYLALITYLIDELDGTIGANYARSQGRVDSIRLTRQSELDDEVTEMVREQLKAYEDRIAALEKQLKQKTEIIAIKDMEIEATSKFGKSSGKRYIKVSWTVSEEVEGLKYQVYKSTKKSSGYSKVKTTSNLSYKNTAGLTKGKTYYYKVRGYKSIGGKTYYTEWSNKTSRKVTK